MDAKLKGICKTEVSNKEKEVFMLADNLRHTVASIRHYQRKSPDAYNCIRNDLDCLVEHLELVTRYLDPLKEDDLSISLPKTISEIKKDSFMDSINLT